MAGHARAVIHRRPLVRASVGADGWPRLAGAGARRRASDSGDDLSSSGRLAHEPVTGLCCELRCDFVRRHFLGVVDLAPSWA